MIEMLLLTTALVVAGLCYKGSCVRRIRRRFILRLAEYITGRRLPPTVDPSRVASREAEWKAEDVWWARFITPPLASSSAAAQKTEASVPVECGMGRHDDEEIRSVGSAHPIRLVCGRCGRTADTKRVLADKVAELDRIVGLSHADVLHREFIFTREQHQSFVRALAEAQAIKAQILREEVTHGVPA
jgi:ribosomal protein S27AE